MTKKVTYRFIITSTSRSMSPLRFISAHFKWFFILALVGCGGKSPSDPRAKVPLVRVATVRQAALEPRSFTGTVAARIQSDLGFRVPGKVLERLVDAGNTVKRGQPLMRIDPIDLQLAAQAQAEQVTAAKARARQTADDEIRYRTLLTSNAVSVSGYDQAKAAADSAKAMLSAEEAKAEVSRNATGYAELVADADGVVMETVVEPGQVVSPGQVVVRLAHAGGREAIVQLPETLRPPVGSVAQAALFGRAGISVMAKLRQLSNSADRLTRTFEARYVLDGELADAPLGATVTIRIQEGDSSLPDGLEIPLGALFDSGKGPGVWVIEGEPAHVAWQPVNVRSLNDDRACIAGQLKAGDRVVALGAHLLREGEPVRVGDGLAAASVEGGAR
jgi:RND family efflux transporter MFP subunit